VATNVPAGGPLSHGGGSKLHYFGAAGRPTGSRLAVSPCSVRTAWAPSILLILATCSWAQTDPATQNTLPDDRLELDNRGPRPGRVPLDYRVVFALHFRSPGEPTPLPVEERPPPVGDRQEIVDEATYRSLVGAPSDGIDWSTERILIVEETTVFKLGQLESAVTMAGISHHSSAISVELTGTQYGPCQGDRAAVGVVLLRPDIPVRTHSRRACRHRLRLPDGLQLSPRHSLIRLRYADGQCGHRLRSDAGCHPHHG